MKFFAVFLPLAFFAHISNGEVRSVFKGSPTSVMSWAVPLKKMTFGLSAKQAKAISHLTNGRILLDDVHYADHASDLDFSSLPGFSGKILPNIPPPFEPVDQPRVGDPELLDQWWIEKLGVPRAWPMATGQGVVIADCDAGFYHDEPDLLSNMLLEHKADLSDLNEPDVVNDGPYASHGTSVSAIMAGVLNASGTNGIAYNSKIVPLQNYNYDSSDDLGKEEATAKCILKAISTPKVNIIVLENQTFNGSSETFIGTRDAVRLALQAGITIVSAGGNYSVELIEEKKDDTGSIIVGALTQRDTLPPWTNVGERITVAAYGEGLYTLSGPNGAFDFFGGTSGATPQVAATVALMIEVNPLLTPEQIRQVLVATRLNTEQTARVGGILKVPEAVEAARDLRPDVTGWINQSLFREQLRTILLNP